MRKSSALLTLLTILTLLLAACQSAATPAAGGQGGAEPLATPAGSGTGDTTGATPSGDTTVATPSGGDTTVATPSGGDTTVATPSGGDTTVATPSGGDTTGGSSAGDVSSCIVGSWQLQDAQAYFASLVGRVPGVPAALAMTQMEGSLTFTFNADGTVQSEADEWTLAFAPGTQVSQQVRLVMNGTTKGTYALSSDPLSQPGSAAGGTPAYPAGGSAGPTATMPGATHGNGTVTETSVTVQVLIDGQASDALTAEQLGVPQGVDGDFLVRCGVDTLEFAPMIDGAAQAVAVEPLRFTRVK